MVTLGRQDLDVWMGEPDDFILAVLRDIYPDEADVKRWLNSPLPELGGRAPVDLISAGHTDELESILVDHWNSR
jgi:hypothetical protein